jgi:hypothetical protein
MKLFLSSTVAFSLFASPAFAQASTSTTTSTTPSGATTASTSTTVSADTTPMPATTTPAVAPTASSSPTTIEQEPTTETKSPINRPLLLTSFLLLGGTYAASAIDAAESGRPSDHKYLYYPVVGPWLDLANRNCEARPCGGETGNKALLILDGVGQGLGALGMITSLFIPEKTTKNWKLRGAGRTDAGGKRLRNRGCRKVLRAPARSGGATVLTAPLARDPRGPVRRCVNPMRDSA